MIKGPRMTVRRERARKRQAGWHRRYDFSDLSQQKNWDRSFLSRKKGAVHMANKEIPYKIYLNEDEMPKYWYNLRADMKN